MTRRQSGVAASLLSVLLLAGLIAHEPAWMTLSVVLLSAILLAEVWRRWCLADVTYRRVFGGRRVPFGDEVDFVVEITNRKLLPLVWLEAEDELPDVLTPLLGRVTRSHLLHRCLLTNLLALRPYEQVRRHYRLACTTRGEHLFGPLNLRSGDMFGMVSREEARPETDLLIVYPRILPVQLTPFAARRLLGEEVVVASLFSDPSRIAGTREYQAGDSVRQIHWPATARAGRLQVKRYDPVGARRLSLCVDIDTNPEGRWWAGYDPDLLELVLVAAVSLAEWAAEQGLPVGLYVNGKPYGEAASVRLGPSARPERRTQVLEILGRLMPYPTGPVEHMLQSGGPRRTAGGTVVLVTGLLYAGKARSLEALARNGRSVVAVLVGDGRDSEAMPAVPTLRLADPQVHWREREAVRFV